MQNTTATTPAASNPPAQDDLNAIAVDLYLSNVPGQVHMGMYRQISDDLYIRDLPWLGVYFSLQWLQPSVATNSVVKWQFRGYECSYDEGEGRVCSEFIAAKLESDQAAYGQTVHVIARQSSLADEERRLQFEMPVSVAPPTFTTQTAYYSCDYSNGGNNWCCAQSNKGSGGPYCWDLNSCSEDYSGWNQQNIICCTSSAADCALTYQPVMPTTTPATTSPATTAPATRSPATTTPATSPPATEDPFNIPILDVTPTQTTTTQTPVTSAPVTTSPVTASPVTTAPVTSAPRQ
ncbi:unnamed protein product [Phytophthora fragariaefolia]|uniref:Unnamed protein product n=1 Tax=Phytophthora fragariaefolia TaxID=1490495 RepID=A0A9W7D0N9_9STRA|nr:unnamed protein product [Phytophthora fragariaefolia]